MRPLLSRLGLMAAPVATGPACVVCGAYPLVAAPLASVGLTGAALVLHYLLWIIAPLNLVPFWISFRRHRNPTGLYLAAIGAVLMMVPLLEHPPFRLHASLHEFLWLGLGFLVAAAIVDRRARRQPTVMLALPKAFK